MRIIGLTGGIASGKSTVARLLEAMGVPVIDADQLGREVMVPGTPAHAEVAARWPQVIRPDGTIDRARLGAIVFADGAQRQLLTGIVLPRIVEAFRSRAAALERAGEEIAVFEAATLYEEGLEHLVDGVLVVSLPPEEQVRRLVLRNGYTEAEARQRLAAQLPLEEKARRARWVITNEGTEADLAHRLGELWPQVVAEARGAGGP